MSLSEKLRKLRDSRNWSQQTLADMMIMDRSTVSRYETGKSLPRYQTLVRFAEIYQVDKEILVGELTEQQPKNDVPGFILKENLEDHDITLILQLFKQEPALKKALLELQLLPPKRRAFYIDLITYQLKAHKKNR
ncbi:helix-turn-helix domain-containing protein [Neobacillus sp. K501]